MEPLLIGVPCQETKIQIFLCSYNVVLGQKHSISSQPISKYQANSGSSHPKQVLLCGPNQLGIFYFSLPCSFFYKSFLHSTPFCCSLNEDCLLHDMLKEVCLYYLNCLIIFFKIHTHIHMIYGHTYIVSIYYVPGVVLNATHIILVNLICQCLENIATVALYPKLPLLQLGFSNSLALVFMWLSFIYYKPLKVSSGDITGITYEI